MREIEGPQFIVESNSQPYYIESAHFNSILESSIVALGVLN